MWSYKDTPSVRRWDLAPEGRSQLQLLPPAVAHGFLKAIHRVLLAQAGSILHSAFTHFHMPDFPCPLCKQAQCPTLGHGKLSKIKLGAFLLNSTFLCLCPLWIKLWQEEQSYGTRWLSGIIALHTLEGKEPPGSKKPFLQLESHRT